MKGLKYSSSLLLLLLSASLTFTGSNWLGKALSSLPSLLLLALAIEASGCSLIFSGIDGGCCCSCSLISSSLLLSGISLLLSGISLLLLGISLLLSGTSLLNSGWKGLK